MALHLAQGLGLSFASIAATLLGSATVASARAHAWTWVQLGLASLLVAFAAVLALVLPHRPKARRVAAVLALLGLARIGWAAAPRRPAESPGALVKTRFVNAAPDARLLWPGIPERETVNLGAWVALSPREYRRNAAAIDAAYAEIEAEDLFERVESPLLDSWFFDREHYWLAVPPRAKGPVPLVVFVHGNGGTFQFYPHLLARAVVERGLAIAFVSNGMGFWSGQDAADRIARVVDAVGREVEVDRSRVSLVGLSAGGPAVVEAALRSSGRYRSVVAVSAIFPEIGERSAPGTRLLILHGAEDPRASVEDARRARDDLARRGTPVELHVDPNEDHLAFLTARERWIPLVLDWVTRP